jgi:hypothetical protein
MPGPANKTMPIIGVGTGSRHSRGEVKAEDHIEPLPEKPTKEQSEFYADHVRRWNTPQDKIREGEVAGSDYRVSVMYDAKGRLTGERVKLPQNK